MNDPIADQWEPGGTINPRRTNFALATLDDKLYLIGGAELTNAVDTYADTTMVEVFDPFELSLTTLSPMPSLRRRIATTELDGKIIVIGGRCLQSTFLKTVETYDPSLEDLD